MQSWDYLTSPITCFGTQVTAKVCEPLGFWKLGIYNTPFWLNKLVVIKLFITQLATCKNGIQKDLSVLVMD